MFDYYNLASFNAYRAQFGLEPLTEKDDKEDEDDDQEDGTSDYVFVMQNTSTNEFHIVDPFNVTTTLNF